MRMWRTVILIDLAIEIFHQATCKDFHISGLAGEDVTLHSRVNASWKLSRITWSIYENRTFIASFQGTSVNNNWFWSYRDRLSLNRTSGDLQIRLLRPSDTKKYTVQLRNSDGDQHTNNIHLTVQESVSEPVIRVLHQVTAGGACVIRLQCTATGPDVNLSWHTNETIRDRCTSGSFNNTVSDLWKILSPNVIVTFTCTASNSHSSRLSSKNVGCPEDDLTPGKACQGCTSSTITAVFSTALIGSVLVLLWHRMQKKRIYQPDRANTH